MDKIYTRHKLRIPKITTNFRGNKKKIKGSIKIVVILILLVIIFIIISKAIYPVFKSLCEEHAKSMITIISNKQATEVMKQYSYENIFEIEKDNDGNVRMIKSNIFTINEITSDVAVKIQEEINKEGKDNIQIPLGTFTGSKLLSGKGPNINIRISTIGNVETDLKSEFIAQGINQTLHRVYLQVKCKASVLTPFNEIETEITNQVLLVENVIVGNIPDTFYNFNGKDEESTAIETLK